MKIGVFQFSPEFGKIDSNISKVRNALKKVDADLMVLPELFSTGYQFKDKEELVSLSEEISTGFTTKSLINIAKEKNLYIVAGLAEKDSSLFYNSAVLVGPEGLIGKFRKAHLFYKEKLYFSQGDTDFEVFDIGIAKIGIMICFDWIYPEVARRLSLKGAEIICHPANLVLPHCQDAMVTRSIENRVFAVTCNRVGYEKRDPPDRLDFTGRSQVTTPKGEILFRLSPRKEELKTIHINPRDAQDKSVTKYNDIFKDRREDLF